MLNEGEIDGFDSHEELIKTSSIYAHMVKIQKFEDEMEGDRYEQK